MIKRNSLILILMMIATMCCMVSSANDSDFVGNITLRDGLSGENIYKIFKDKRGLVWLGTSDGLNSFNGVTLHAYRTNNNKQNNYVTDIAETSDGRFYVATPAGVYQMVNDSLVNACPDIDCTVSALAADGDVLYIGADRGFYMLSGGRTMRYLISSNTLSDENRVNDIFVDAQHRVWIATDRALASFDKKSHRMRTVDVGGKMQLVGKLHCLTALGKSVFLGSSNDGIIRYDMSTGRLSRYLSVDCNIISELSTDGRDQLYVATDGNGAHIISVSRNQILKSFTTSSKPFSLKDNSVYCFLHDVSGVNFFGFFRQGLMYTYYVNPIFHTYSYRDFTTENMNVRSFTINGSQKLIGTRSGFYFIDEARGIVRYYSPQQIGGSIVISNTFYHGKYYICTFDGGVKILDPASLQVSPMNVNPTLAKGSIFSATVYNDMLWITTSNGLYCYHANTGKTDSYTAGNSGLLEGFVNCIAFDRIGNGWIGTQKGVCLMNGGNRTIKSTDFPDGFFNKTNEMYFTQGYGDRMIGFGHSGVYESKSDMSQFKNIALDENVYDENCAFVKFDGNNRCWMATDKGLFYFDRDMKSYIQYGTMDNLRGTAFNTKAVYIDKENNIWMGCNNGLIYASVSNIRARHFRNNYPIILGNVSVDDALVGNSVEDDIISRKTISLDWNVTSDELAFTPIVLNYSNPVNTYFEYRIDDGRWYTSVGTGNILCHGLLPGTHTLSLRLAGSDACTSYRISVSPSVMAYAEMIILAIFVFFVVLFVVRRKKILKAMYLAETEETDDAPKVKYSRVKMDNDEYVAIVSSLEAYLKEKKPYLDSNLKMSEIAAAIGCSANKLSQVFSLYLNQNYYDYINNYRLEEFKQMVKNPEYSKYTIAALSEQCGFRKTAFFNTFKRVMGITPTEYMQQINKK
jgi:ligand-binding sensor domain-containing protein/AraC-like DNA-binding protein